MIGVLDAESEGGSAGEQKSEMRVQIQYEIDKQLLSFSFRYYTYILVSIIFTDNMRKCHHVMADGLRFRSG